ncbi:MAG TPA: hypothetical protein VI365_02705 [Trebonia sp.]
MILAVKTTTSSAGLWVIVVVAVGSVALWLYLVEVHATRRGTPPRRSGATSATPETAVTRDDLPRVPQPRPDSDRVPEGNRAATTARDGSAARDASDPGVQWTLPGQRQSPTDQPASAEPGQDRRGGGPQEPG